jgi:hypothetical protein
MVIRHFFCYTLLMLSVSCLAQETAKRSTDEATVVVGIGSHRGSISFSYEHNWKIGKKRKLQLGIGSRLTSFLGANLNYTTAPAELTTESTSPLVLFQENVEENIDTILVKSPQVNALNFFINIGYRISSKFQIGFSIDAIGFSFGKDTQVDFISGNTGRITSASPTPFNILLISDNDKGTLNSDLHLKYSVNSCWSIRMGIQFLFTEYTTAEKVQQYPEENDRFRNKSLLGMIGVSLNL